MIVADTGAVVALIDADDRHHGTLRRLFEDDSAAWVLPAAILPEVDHLVSSRLGPSVARLFRRDLTDGGFVVEWGTDVDLARAVALDEGHGDLQLGLVDTMVMAVAERLNARAVATLDLRDFGSVVLEGAPELWPRDL